MSRGIRARIDRSALRYNLARARGLAQGSRVIAVVKADGYGHGLIETARSLEDADAFAVESIEEGIKLRENGTEQEVLLLSGFHEERDIYAIDRWKLSPVIHDRWQVLALGRRESPQTVNIWIKIDSGMHRIGFDPDNFPRVLETLEGFSNVQIQGLLSHLANADDLSDNTTRDQCRRFRGTAGGCSYELSLANSAGVLGWRDTHLDWIRPGMMLYGCSSVLGRTEKQLGLRPAMTLEARIIAIKDVPKGQAIGYGSTWVCDSATRVGVLACGYGDGYPRHAPSGTPVWVKGCPGRTLGRISMDLMSIDLSGCENACIGDWVELWGANVTASIVATHAGTIPYELVTRVTARVPRLYES